MSLQPTLEQGQAIWEKLAIGLHLYTQEELAKVDTVSICKRISIYHEKHMDGNRSLSGYRFIYDKKQETELGCVFFVDGYIEGITNPAVEGLTTEYMVCGVPNNALNGAPAVSQCTIDEKSGDWRFRVEYWEYGKQTKIITGLSESEYWHLMNPEIK